MGFDIYVNTYIIIDWDEFVEYCALRARKDLDPDDRKIIAEWVNNLGDGQGNKPDNLFQDFKLRIYYNKFMISVEKGDNPIYAFLEENDDNFGSDSNLSADVYLIALLFDKFGYEHVRNENIISSGVSIKDSKLKIKIHSTSSYKCRENVDIDYEQIASEIKKYNKIFTSANVKTKVCID